MVRTTLAIEREVEDAQSIRDKSASGKRKKDQPSSSSGRKWKTSIQWGFQGRGGGYQDQGRVAAYSQMG